MNQYETGKYVPDYITMVNIAKVLKIPPAYFYCDDDQLAELIMLYGRLSKEKRESLVAFAASITN